jgi:hypothetical protein
LSTAIHPNVDLIEKRAVAWIDRYLCPDRLRRTRLLESRSTEFYARCAPSGITERVEAASEWTYMAFWFDDLYDNGTSEERLRAFLATAPHMSHVVDTPGLYTPLEPALAALRDIASRFHRCGAPTSARRFADAHRQWLLGVAGEIDNARTGRRMDVDECTRTRLRANGGPVLTSMLEFVSGIQVPETEWSSYPVRALTEITWLLLGWDNDLHSYRKEVDEYASDNNLIEVLGREHHLAADEAVAEAVAMRDRCMVLFLRLAERSRRTASAELNTYVDSLGQVIRANNDWGFRAPRYTTAVDSTLATRLAEYSDKPSVGRQDPITPPSIAWWWELLE